MSSPNDPAYGINDSPLINLQSFRPRTKYARIPSDYAQDQSALLPPLSPYAGAGASVSATDYIQRKPPGKMARVRHTTSAVFDRKTYMPFSHLLEEADSADNKPFHGWRSGVVAAAIVTGVVLLINLIFLIVGVARFVPSDGLGVIYTGDCNRVKRWNTALHLLINLLGTAILGASSFTMQCLSSPTRSEVDRAHAKKVPLDIGLASLKNLFYLDWRKGMLWWALTLSTLPLHLLWNSTVFSTLGATEFSTIIVDEGFLRGDSFMSRYENDCWSDYLEDIPGIDASGLKEDSSYGGNSGTSAFASIYDSYKAGNYSQRLNASDCIDAYAVTFVSQRRNLLAITQPVAGSTRMSPSCAFSDHQQNESYVQPRWNGSSVLAFENQLDNSVMNWLCNGYDAYVSFKLFQPACDRAKAQSLLAENGTWYLRPLDIGLFSHGTSISAMESYPVEYCLSEDKIPQRCTLQYVSYLLGAVVACNIIKVICMIAAAFLLWDLDEPIFATVGDAVASYLERPDENTVGWCLMGRKEAKAWRRNQLEQQKQALYNPPMRNRLFSATSKTRWFTTVGLCTLYLVVGIVLLILSVGGARSAYTVSQIWALGLGDVNSHTNLGISGNTTAGLLRDVLVANSFQLALSTTYFLYNSLYTAQCSAIEWASYTIKRRPLRVTYPRGQQRSTYWLQLPYTYGLLLTTFLMLMHFLISQAIFLVRVQWYTEAGILSKSFYISDVGFSPLAILVSCCVGALLILFQVGNSLRPLKANIPLHGNNSVAISAACHPGTRSENDQGVLFRHPEANMALRTVMWGAMVQPKGENERGHCSFTADQVEMPERGRRYQGYSAEDDETNELQN